MADKKQALEDALLQRELNAKQGRGPGAPMMDGNGRIRDREKGLMELLGDQLVLSDPNIGMYQEKQRLLRTGETPEVRQKVRDMMPHVGDIDLPRQRKKGK